MRFPSRPSRSMAKPTKRSERLVRPISAWLVTNGREVEHAAGFPAQAIGGRTDRLPESFRGEAHAPSGAALQVRPVQDVHATLIGHGGESGHREHKTEKCDCFDSHLRPPP